MQLKLYKIYATKIIKVFSVQNIKSFYKPLVFLKLKLYKIDSTKIIKVFSVQNH